MKRDIIIFIGQIAAGKTTVSRKLATVLDGEFITIEEMPSTVRITGVPAIVAFATQKQVSRPLIFECSGTAENFEELLSEFELNARRVLVVKLLCQPAIALERLSKRTPWRPPTSGVSWNGEILRTESRLRRVPSDLTIDTTYLDVSNIVPMVQNFLAATQATTDNLPKASNRLESFSKLALHERCPLAHEFKYISRVPEIFLSEKTLLGEHVHQALARLYLSKSKSEDLELNQLLEGYTDSLERLPQGSSSPGLYDSLLDEGKKLLSFHYRTVYECDKLSTIRVEHNFVFDLGSGSKLTGQIDRLARSGSGIPVIIDYKTGSDRTSYLSDVPDLLQLEVYGVAILLELRVNAVEVRRHSVRTAHEDCYSVTTNDIPRIRASILRWIRKFEKTQYPNAKPGKICQWCAYNPKCTFRSCDTGNGLTLSSSK